MRKSSIKSKVTMFISLGVLMAAMAMPVFANNYEDTRYSFDFGNGYWQTTPERIKEDDTYVYMYCDSSHTPGDSYYAWAWGYNSDTRSDFESSKRYQFFNGTVYKMTNYIYENDGDYAYVKARHAGSGVGKFSGLWSPDSI